jgi:hypothetical protein
LFDTPRHSRGPAFSLLRSRRNCAGRVSGSSGASSLLGGTATSQGGGSCSVFGRDSYL